ncbi:FAD-binding and (Fe-S)-binding domain-containing protein [Arsenophonus nasoniae]|uniref:D-2-hydroxyglutarate dehydrogenase YdiJ n=1 Tax=Arsenophonus nasoniae TaxID=638 RepID=UPI0038794825
MIQRIGRSHQVSQQITKYLTILKEQGFSGDLTTSYAERLSMATDNSIYQLLPQAVVYPRSTSDVQLLAKLATDKQFQSLTFTPRGGGTGTNGQALTEGIVVDLSRYMQKILQIDVAQKWVRVEAGVIKDQLNQFLAPYGYFFSPELSTSNRATLGGMINTDASGQGSLVYGKTSDHVLSIKAVLLGGDVLETSPMPVESAKRIAQQQSTIGRIYRTVYQHCHQQRQLILAKFPRLNRFLTGYDLRHVFNDSMTHFDLTRILTGSEGTLAFITEAKLNITPLPKVRRLVNINYDSFDSALRNAPFMVAANALSVETVDAKILSLARQDIIWQSVSKLVNDVDGKKISALNIVEFSGDNEEKINQQLTRLCSQLDKLKQAGNSGILGYQICHHLADIERIYTMRKKAVGLLANTKGLAKSIPFVEDTCVPPEHLADYIAEFRALLDRNNLAYGMFGHVDAGVLHVRPVMDMCDPQQEVLMKQISDQIVQLTAKYGGLLWGEHGKGFRSSYGRQFFGNQLYQILCHIKTAFDPFNQLNPGKICSSLNVELPLIPIDTVKRGTYDRIIPINVRQTFERVMACNGNGLCFNFDVNSPMCPSMKISQQRIHSPKGRATLMREWLRLQVKHGINLKLFAEDIKSYKLSWWQKITRLYHTLRAKCGQYDFSHEVKEAMAGCLACKACSTQCPVKIDVPTFRAKFLALYYSRYLRPISDYVVASIELTLPLMAKHPRWFNFILQQKCIQTLSYKVIGLTDFPQLSTPSLQQQLAAHAALSLSLSQLESLSEKMRSQFVFIVQDPFTSYYDAKVVADFIHLIERLGYRPILLPFSANGKALHIKGYLTRFAETAQKTANFLNRLAKLSIPMVGIDPALVLCYRDEYSQILGNKRGDFEVKLVNEWLITALASKPVSKLTTEKWYLLGHCTEMSLLAASAQHWIKIFAQFGCQLINVNVGCCGMAGTYGHEVKHLANSKGIYALSWGNQLQKLPLKRCLATGYSCRSQVKRMEKEIIKHPLQALLEIIK